MSKDPAVARKEIAGIIFYLATVGYIDGEFAREEIEYVRKTIKNLVIHWAESAFDSITEKEREHFIHRETVHFQEVFEGIRREVIHLLSESVIEAETQHFFISCKLKQRCFEVFGEFESTQHKQLIDALDELLEADGRVHPAEVKLREELSGLLEASQKYKSASLKKSKARPRPDIKINNRALRSHVPKNHPSFSLYEHHYVKDARTLKRQITSDQKLIKRVISVLGQLRKTGKGKLRYKKEIDHLVGFKPFLDGHVFVNPISEEKQYEITVIGDLHGCYSCLKAALVQSDFFAKVANYREDPHKYPEPKLVFLGDYIDRGRFSLNGVLRLVLQLFSAMPEHVYILRGNHEMLIEERGEIRSVVFPSHAFEMLRPFAPASFFRSYKKLFDNLPTSLIFGRLLFTHGGIPRDSLIKSRFHDLSSLNDPAIRFQMMWSDPGIVDVIPQPLQEQSVRFSFGRLQCQDFLQHIGCHTLIRGHGLVTTGFSANYHDENMTLITLCSAGGPTNQDLPPISDFRLVRPMASTIYSTGGLNGPLSIEAWPIEYEPYNTSEQNGFYKPPPTDAIAFPQPDAAPHIEI